MTTVKDKLEVSPYFVFFLMYAAMVEIGNLNFQRIIIKHAGYNAWISVLVTGICIHLIIWMMYRICSSNEDIDLTLINRQCFGKWFGKALDLSIVCYFFCGAFLTFRNYIDIIQMFFFPETSMILVSLVVFVLLYYIISGGFRTVAGISLWGVLSSVLLVTPISLLVYKYLHPQNLLPLWNHSVTDVLLSAKSMVFQFLGIEALLLYYPFIKTPAKSQKWAHIAIMAVTAYYLYILVLTFMFYSEGHLKQIAWPTIHMVMIVKLPLIQRLEYFVIPILFIKIAACIALGLWAACRGAKNALHIRQPISLIVFLAGFLILTILIKEHALVIRLTEWYSSVGFYFIFAYIPLLFVLTRIRRLAS